MMNGNKGEAWRTGRITLGILAMSNLLLPIGLSAAELKDTGSSAVSKQDLLFQRLEELEKANSVQQELIRLFVKEQERLKQRVVELEAAKTTQKAEIKEAEVPSTIKEQERLPQHADEIVSVKSSRKDSTGDDAIRTFSQEQEKLKQRVEELETNKTAQEDATRSIIRDSFSKLGSNINQNVNLGGTIEGITGWAQDFSGPPKDFLELTTAQLDFEIRANDWTTGIFTIEYDNGTNILFPTVGGFDVAGERLNIETALVTIGDTQRFPPFLTFGKIVLPFGISTGTPVADTLTIEDPLTLEVFEMRKTAIGFGLGFPTPAVTPLAFPAPQPLVKPQLINPLFSSLSKQLGYNPPPVRPPAPTLFTPTPEPPLFNVGIYSYDGNSTGWDPGKHINATAGFRTQGNCGQSYEQLSDSILCPWAIDIDVDFNSSIFDSRFLGFEYQNFLNQIGFVPGMAVSAKARFGAVSLVTEWNGAIKQANFVDGLNHSINIMPSAWQISLGYQFDWNPWVEVIGEKGTYLALGYSESQDLAGVFDLSGNKVGFVPKQRFLINMSEWILDNVRFSVEYSHIIDYSEIEGGTGKSANGIFSSITYVW